jgi:ERCC4-type nuclease
LSESEKTFVGFKSHNKSDRNAEIGLKSHKKDIKSEVIESHSKNDSKHSIKEIEKKIIESVPEVTTLRDVQLRQAFKSANTSMKKRPLTHVGGTARSDGTHR